MTSSNSSTNVLKPETTLDGIPIRTIFVGNIRIGATEIELRNAFSHLGEIISASVNKPHTLVPGKKCTFGFLTFQDPLVAARALQLSGAKKFYGRTLFLNPADSWHQPTEMPDGRIVPRVAKPRIAYRVVNAVEQLLRDLGRRGQEIDNEEIEEELVEEEVVDLNSDCLINKLVDDCLRVVFEYVGVQHHHVLSRVCRRWRLLMFEFWDKITVLDLSSGPLSEVNMSNGSIKTYFSLCRNINSVVLDQKGHRITSQSIATTACSVPDLQHLSLVNFSLVQRPLSIIALRCPNLRSFSMKDCNYKHDNEISPLLKRCLNLESISLRNCPYHSGSWLSQLGPPVSSLSLINLSLDITALSKCLNHLAPSLKELVVIFKLQGVNLPLPLLPKLEKLILGSSYVITRNPTYGIKGLKHLELFRTEISKGCWIKNLVEENPDLEVLNISAGLINFDPHEFEPLVELKKLRHLNLSRLSCVDDIVLGKLCKKDWKLASLSLCDCAIITDAGCKRLITELSNLTFLDLRGCDQISPTTLQATAEARNADSSKQHLNLVVDVDDDDNATCEVPFVWNAGCKDADYFNRIAEHAAHYDGFDDFIDDDDYDDDDDELYDIDDDYIFGEEIDEHLRMNNFLFDDDDDSDYELRLQGILFDDMDDGVVHFLM